MPLDTMEIIAAALREGPIAADAQRLSAALPPKAERKAVDYGPIVGAKPGTVVYKILAEVSDPVHELKDLIDILELDPESPLGLQFGALDILIADIKD